MIVPTRAVVQMKKKFIDADELNGQIVGAAALKGFRDDGAGRRPRRGRHRDGENEAWRGCDRGSRGCRKHKMAAGYG